jgi:Domain of unknown function (DUF5047)
VRPVSAGWDSTIRGSHHMVVRARVCSTFQTGTDPDGTEIQIVDGQVSLDGTAQVRTTLDLTTNGRRDDGRRLWPRFASDLLAPYGNELYVERGVQYSDDTVEYVGLGYLRIEGPSQDNPPDGPIRITGQDRMAAIVEGDLTDPVQFLAGTTIGDVVEQLVTDIYPTAVIEWDDATDAETLTRSVVADQDRYAFLDELVTAHGKIWYWDHRGVLVIKDLPDPGFPVFDLVSGRGGTLVSMTRELTRGGVYNAVVATGEAGDNTPPVRAMAFDSNPDSPTYYLGRFGKVPQFFTSPLLGSTGQAQAAAETLLRKQLGLPYTVRFGMVANSALEPFDPVLARYSDTAAAETHVLQTLTIPLTEGGQMQATTKAQTTILIGHS